VDTIRRHRNKTWLPLHPWSKTVIYETHVRGFTIHPKSGVDHPGTYRGLMEKISYLKTLGVTAVELMPVQEFNETSVTRPVSVPLEGLVDKYAFRHRPGIVQLRETTPELSGHSGSATITDTLGDFPIWR
jgi:pullulanase/glycogen debranching enzyme